jgi:hypothetical protein
MHSHHLSNLITRIIKLEPDPLCYEIPISIVYDNLPQEIAWKIHLMRRNKMTPSAHAIKERDIRERLSKKIKCLKFVKQYNEDERITDDTVTHCALFENYNNQEFWMKKSYERNVIDNIGTILKMYKYNHFEYLICNNCGCFFNCNKRDQFKNNEKLKNKVSHKRAFCSCRGY